jgi:WhiB family transcriptional regulator, redox-sensing transcriptional regulator
MIEYATNWRAASACLTTDPDVFFPVAVGTAASKQVSRALRICQGYPVRQQCLDFAMRSGEKDGIWGGTTPEERIRARRMRNRRPGRRTWEEAPTTRAS